MFVNVLLISGFLATILLSFLSTSIAFPLLNIINRWLKRVFLSTALAIFVNFLEIFYAKPIWLLSFLILLVMLLLESIYLWFNIRLLSYSTMPLFPRFFNDHQSLLWHQVLIPTNIQEWLKKHSFKHEQNLKSESLAGVLIRSAVYHESTHKIRLQILLIPSLLGKLKTFYIFSSYFESDTLVITDNIQLPFGGFCPPTWHVSRCPLIFSIDHLFKSHNKKIQKMDQSYIPWENPPLEDINRQQHFLESESINAGFLFPIHLQEEYGRISWEGRYFLWKDIFLLKYFGLSLIK